MKILFVNNNMFGLNIFRGEVIKALKRKGYDVKTCSPKDEQNNLEKFGIPHFSIKLEARGINPLTDLKYFFDLWKIYKTENPDLIFHYTIKPNIYGTLAAKLNGIKSIAVLAGLGQMFTEKSLKSKLARMMYKYSLKYSEEVWFLNDEDRSLAIRLRIIKEEKAFILPGEGINTLEYKPIKKSNTTNNKIKFLMISRILWDKGIKEYFEAAKFLKEKYSDIEFQLLGSVAEKDATGVPISYIKKYTNDGIINYLGTTNNVKEIIKNVDCVILPSFYREGMPRVLLEAGSMEKVIITTKNVGCKEVVKDNYNGFLCRVQSSEDLINKIEKFLKLDIEERKRMGKNSRKYIEAKFDIKIIEKIYMNKIKNLLKE